MEYYKVSLEVIVQAANKHHSLNVVSDFMKSAVEDGDLVAFQVAPGGPNGTENFHKILVPKIEVDQLFDYPTEP